MYIGGLRAKGFLNILPKGLSVSQRKACAVSLREIGASAKKNKCCAFLTRGGGSFKDKIWMSVYDKKSGERLYQEVAKRDDFVKTPEVIADKLICAADSAKFYRLDAKAQKAADAAKPQVPLSQKIVNLLKSH